MQRSDGEDGIEGKEENARAKSQNPKTDSPDKESRQESEELNLPKYLSMPWHLQLLAVVVIWYMIR
ncbi:MAG: hypothetical protein IPJ20_19900 [Flammeovirgaceae bacterium]|nr:hypothetical protein [Flammeovirgaceae bacterium]